MAIVFFDGWDTDAGVKETAEELRKLAKKHKIGIVTATQMASNYWKARFGENVIRFIPGGDKMEYEPTLTVRILKNRYQETSTRYEEKPCCDWDTDADGNCPRHPWWAPAGIERGEFVRTGPTELEWRPLGAPNSKGCEIETLLAGEDLGEHIADNPPTYLNTHEQTTVRELLVKFRGHWAFEMTRDELLQKYAEKNFKTVSTYQFLLSSQRDQRLGLYLGVDGDLLGALHQVDVSSNIFLFDYSYEDLCNLTEQQELQDVAANAATLRERLRVETHVRLASSKPLLAQDDVRYTMLDIGEWTGRLGHNESFETVQRLELACAGLPEDFNALPHK